MIIVTCAMLVVSELYIYPVKSLGGIPINHGELTDRGFRHDRRWMLVDENNRFLTQREHPRMAMLQTVLTEDGIHVLHKTQTASNIIIPFSYSPDKRIVVNIWDDVCEAVTVDDKLDEWFSDALSISCKLVHMPDNTMRKVDERYAVSKNEVTSFSDAYPLLMISKESLNDLNNRLPEPLPVNRFRPNIVMEGGLPYEEDRMQHFRINEINFYGVKLCARCSIPTIDQETGKKNKEPTKTLADYRRKGQNVYFGQNVLYRNTGYIKPGDEITILQSKASPVFDSAG